MYYLVIGIVLLVVVVMISTFFSKSTNSDQEEIKEVDPTCCGAHEICELDLRKLEKKIIYFEDEDLDIYKHRTENSYDEKEIDQFRNILYTLKSEEIREWINSLEIREINLPEPLKQETLSLLA